MRISSEMNLYQDYSRMQTEKIAAIDRIQNGQAESARTGEGVSSGQIVSNGQVVSDGGQDKAGEEAMVGATQKTERSQAGMNRIPNIQISVEKDFKQNRDLIGTTASLENLDVQKAISGMKKDQILREYQVFIQNPETGDGSVRKYLKQ